MPPVQILALDRAKKRFEKSTAGITNLSIKTEVSFFMPFTYILFSEKLNKFYIGACINLEHRIYEHNIGHSKFTATGLPWILKYSKEFPTLKEAKVFETKIKRMKSRKYIVDLIAQG